MTDSSAQRSGAGPPGRAFDAAGAGLFVAAVALWAARDAVAWALAGAFPGVGYPLLSLLVRGAVGLVLAAGLYRLRAGLSAAGQRALGFVDAAEAKLDALPRARGKVLRALGIAAVTGGAIAALGEGTGLGGWLETRAVDLFFRMRFPDYSQVELATGRAKPSAKRQDDVVVVALDDETITHLGWPMPRVHYARLIDAVAESKPDSLTFDVSLVDASREHPDWDAAIGDAAKRAGNVAFSFTVAPVVGSRPATSPKALAALDANSIPWQGAAAALPEYTELVSGDAAPQPVIDPVAENAAAIAMANVLLDGGDDVLRHSLLVARLGKRLLPSLSLRLAAKSLGVPLQDIRIVPGSHVDLGGKRTIPIDRLGRTLVRYQGRHDTRGSGPFRYVSMWSLLRSDATVTLAGNPMGDDQRFVLDDGAKVTRDGVVVSLAEVEGLLHAPGAAVAGKALYATDPGRIVELALTTGKAPPAEPDFELIDEQVLRFDTSLASWKSNRGAIAELAGKHVLVGSTALAAADLRNSSLGEMPGVEHHATMLANLLHGDFFHQAPRWASTAMPLGAALLAAVLGVAFSSELGLLLSGALALLLLTLSYLAFASGLYVPIVTPPVAVGVSYLATLVLGARASRNARAKAEQERAFVRETFGRYLTEQVVQTLLDQPDGLKLGGQRDFVTIMMTDLRGFTSMCGSMEPEGVVKLLNHYLETMTRIINKYGGTIDEFIGDAILVVFGAPLPLDREEARAVACAIEMLNAMPEINQWNRAQGLPEVEMGIGIHSGEVVLGNIGSELRAKYGIVGSTINLTSRVESYTVGGQVLISETTRELCGELVTVGTSQTVSPKGVKGTLTIHEALAVGAPFDVRLASANEELVPPRAPIELRYGTVKNKQVAALSQVAHVEALSAQGLELRVDEALPVLSDLQLRVVDGEGLKPGDLYGKVLKANVRPNVVYLRLTSVPPELRSLLEAARGGAAPTKEPVSDSALVSS